MPVLSLPHLKYLVILCLGLCLGACSSAPSPSSWQNSRFQHDLKDVERTIRRVMTQKFDYRIRDYHQKQNGLISFSTDWNLRQAYGAIFSRNGVRRKAWVEIKEVAKEKSPLPLPQDSVEKRFPSSSRNTEVRLRIAVESEHNASIMHPDKPDQAQWEEAGPDDNEAKRILAELHFAMLDYASNTSSEQP